ACVLIGATAVGYLTRSALGLEKREAAGTVQSESERLSLWRMESLLVPLIARENARPPVSYQSFYPTSEAYSKLMAPIGKGEVLVPSPLLTFKSDYIQLHFELCESETVFCSPQVPLGNQRDLCEVYVCPAEELEPQEQRFSKFLNCVTPEEVRQTANSLPVELANDRLQIVWAEPSEFEPNYSMSNGLSPQQQQDRNRKELSKRTQTLQNNAAVQQAVPLSSLGNDEPPIPALTPVWIKNELVLLRRVSIDGRDVIQGCWLDWKAIDQWLCTEVEDLLPSASLTAIKSPVSDADRSLKLEDINPLRFASLPVELKPGVAAGTEIRGVTPIRLALGTAWIGLLAASIAAGVLLFAALRMSQRRGAFVSAVTHELRTPLTTFRVYTDLLGDDRQKDPNKRAGYVQTLRRQAERLDHLVDNVLSYARLENKSHDARAEDVQLNDFFSRVEPTLRDLADQANMQFAIRNPDEKADVLTVRADPDAVERILFNLVDNACKYGVGTDRREIELSCEHAHPHAIIRVRDYGRGVSTNDRATLFEEFTKSAADAARSAPGVGLGLSLSRRLARCMRGDLILERDIADGASFVLKLPLASR
ncbi:MAG: sensor histidine kinase, partial [Planctomycetaceae bacterium]